MVAWHRSRNSSRGTTIGRGRTTSVAARVATIVAAAVVANGFDHALVDRNLLHHFNLDQLLLGPHTATARRTPFLDAFVAQPEMALAIAAAIVIAIAITVGLAAEAAGARNAEVFAFAFPFVIFDFFDFTNPAANLTQVLLAAAVIAARSTVVAGNDVRGAEE